MKIPPSTSVKLPPEEAKRFVVVRELLCRWVDEGATVREIARRLGCSRSWAGELLRRSGVSRRRVVVPEEMRRRLRL